MRGGLPVGFSPFPGGLEFPIPLGEDRFRPPFEFVLRRDKSNGTL